MCHSLLNLKTNIILKISDVPFNMNTQILIPLDDMTPENGATSLRPCSHIEIEYPTDVEEYRSK